MGLENKKKQIALPVFLSACLLLFLLAGGAFFVKYLQARIFEERTTQLTELTSQVRVNLANALDSHWNYLAFAVNSLKRQEFDTAEDLTACIGGLERTMETERFGGTLMLLDSQGNCYDAVGKHGVWSDIGLISGGGERYTFISDSYIYEGACWAFVQKLDAPLQPENGPRITHVVLLKDVQTMTRYYDSAAYGSQNETYVLKSNGTRMHDGLSQENMIRTYNVLRTLEEMEGQRYPDIQAAMEETGTLSANFVKDGEEYYYCVASLEDYDTLLLFLIPARYVASGTVGMVGMVVRTLLFLTVVSLTLLMLAAGAIVRQRNSVRMYREEQASLRHQEEMNRRLEESNAMLAQSKETAEEAFRIAEEANRAKSSFLSNMSHDIRTPMNAVIGFATLLARDADDPEKVREYTRKITASSQHLLGLINDILDISKIEAGKTTLNLSDTSLADLIENIDGIIRPQMKAKGHTFEVYSRDLRHERVVLDTLRVNQILLNLLSNAAKYTPDGGRVTLTVQELPQLSQQLARFRFVVEDNGYGMSREFQRTLFQAFTREEDSVTNKIQGTGLGMAITKNLLDLMGGTIQVESEKGRGSVFTVDLELQVSEQENGWSFWQDHGVARLLAVDDEEAICRNIRRVMESVGVTADWALSGQEALDRLRRAGEEGCPYQIVLLDWKMPGMDGLETACRIRREMPENGPVIILTSCDWPEGEEERTADVDAFLPKPFFLTSFRRKVEMVLSRGTEAGENAGEKASGEEEESALRGMHILVAEDNEINAEILTELLDMAGADCVVFENGKLAVEEFERSAPGQYQLILMDVQMPVMNGYEAARAIRASGHPLAKTIPIVAMTANAFAEDIRDAIEAGMDSHVAKPVDMGMLERTVRLILGGVYGEMLCVAPGSAQKAPRLLPPGQDSDFLSGTLTASRLESPKKML